MHRDTKSLFDGLCMPRITTVRSERGVANRSASAEATLNDAAEIMRLIEAIRGGDLMVVR